MMITLTIKNFTPEKEYWLMKNVGPKMHHLHNSIGGQGWIAKHTWTPGMISKAWALTLEDERYATYFTLMFPE